jgi:hypothetical protein
MSIQIRTTSSLQPCRRVLKVSEYSLMPLAFPAAARREHEPERDGVAARSLTAAFLGSAPSTTVPGNRSLGRRWGRAVAIGPLLMPTRNDTSA